MIARKSDIYPIVFQPYTITLTIQNEEDDNKLKSIFLNYDVVSKALANQGYDRDCIQDFIQQIGLLLED